MIAKGQDATNIQLGDTLANDLFADQTLRLLPVQPAVRGRLEGLGRRHRRRATTDRCRTAGSAPACPSIRDGQMLFLSHLVSKMRPRKDGGGRAGIVLNGSPLFNGGAESGESEIRRWLLENDLVDAIVALPTNMFYNTGIATYIWILDNTKRHGASRQGAADRRHHLLHQDAQEPRQQVPRGR